MGLMGHSVAIKNGTFIVDLPIKMVIFHSYVTLPEGMNLTLRTFSLGAALDSVMSCYVHMSYI